MIGLLTGGTGDGKSLYAVTVLLRDAYLKNRERNALIPDTEDVLCDDAERCKALRAQKKDWEPLRDFRSNIKGVTNPGRIPGVTILPLEKDWRQYRDGTVCVYDESHKKGWFRTTGKPGLSDDDVITELDEHRHRGFDIWFLTQFPTKIHHEVRQLVKRHIHLVRSHGMQRSMLFEWQKVVNNLDEDEKVQKLEGEIWEFRVEGFDWYDSTSMDTHKATFPKALKRALVTIPVLLLAMVAVWWFLIRPDPVEAKEATTGEAKASAAAPVAPPAGGGGGSVYPPGMEWATAPAVPKFKGCAVLSRSCRCWNGAGQQLLLSQAECIALAPDPLPIDFSTAAAGPLPGALPEVGPGAGQVSGPASLDFSGLGPAVSSGVAGGAARIGDAMPGVIEASRR